MLLLQYCNGEATTYTFKMREPDGRLIASFEPTGANLRYYHFDNLGSTVLVTNGSGTVSQSYAYDAWGNALAGGDGLKPYQYVGELGYYTHSTAQGDALADLLQLGVRFYDPEIGRFTQRDQIWNIMTSDYTYADDNPLTMVDPDGRWCYKEDRIILTDPKLIKTELVGTGYIDIVEKAGTNIMGTVWRHFECNFEWDQREYYENELQDQTVTTCGFWCLATSQKITVNKSWKNTWYKDVRDKRYTTDISILAIRLTPTNGLDVLKNECLSAARYKDKIPPKGNWRPVF